MRFDEIIEKRMRSETIVWGIVLLEKNNLTRAGDIAETQTVTRLPIAFGGGEKFHLLHVLVVQGDEGSKF